MSGVIDNPFILVYDALWTLAERNETLMELIKLKNRIKYDDVLGPKKNISDADLPELELIQAGAECNLMDSSSTTKVVRQYTWGITTGEFEVNPFYNSVSWELLCAMVDWDSVLCALTWPDEDWHFVVRTNVISADEGTIMRKNNRGILGWAGMWTIDVQMHFRTIDMRIT